MKTRLVSRLITISVMLSFVAILCAKPAPAKELVMVSYLPESLFTSQAMKYFGDLVTERTKGQVTFRYYWSGALASAKEVVPMLSSGGADMGFVAVGYYPADFPYSTLGELVMLSNHMGSTQKAVSQLYKENPEFLAEFDRLNLKPLITAVADISPLGLNKKIESIEDLKGMRVRTYGTIAPLIKAWGAVPIAMSSSEIYQSVQTGLLDGFTAQPLQDFRAKSLDKVTKYAIEVGIGIYHTGYYPMNKDTFASFSPEIQQIIEQAAVEANAKSNEINIQNTRKAIPLVLKNGLKLYSVSDEVKQELRKIGLPVVKQGWIDQAVKGGVDESKARRMLNRFEELCTKYDKKPDTKNYWEIYQEEFAK